MSCSILVQSLTKGHMVSKHRLRFQLVMLMILNTDHGVRPTELKQNTC